MITNFGVSVIALVSNDATEACFLS